jgi:hypothetical protein
MFDRDVLTMSLAPKDEHEAQVQFALERGIPAISAVMGTKRLPYPSKVFDVIHCARCRVPWHIEGLSCLRNAFLSFADVLGMSILLLSLATYRWLAFAGIEPPVTPWWLLCLVCYSCLPKYPRRCRDLEWYWTNCFLKFHPK